MPFKTKFGLELFNDCIYYRSEAIKLLENDRDANIFEIRRALRSSYISLWMHWEYWLNTELESLVYNEAKSIKDVDSIDKDSDDSSTRLKNLLTSDVETKLDKLVLLSGIDIRSDEKLTSDLTSMRKYRNMILHPKTYIIIDSVEDFLSKLNKAIHTTRQFFEYWSKFEGTNVYDYLNFDKPVDMKSMGFGIIRRAKVKSS